jgi:DNA-binding MarR family transcriptional regulator
MIQETQREAYKELKDVESKRNLVLKAIYQYDGLTLFELVKILGWPVNRITGRVNELVAKELVKDSGRRRINPDSKKSGIVWVVT